MSLRCRPETAVILLQLADDGQHGILLKGVEFIPNQAALKSGCFVGQNVLADILEKIMEDVVESKEVEKLWAVFLAGSGDDTLLCGEISACRSSDNFWVIVIDNHHS